MIFSGVLSEEPGEAKSLLPFSSGACFRMINQFSSFLERFLKNRKNGDSGRDLEQMPEDFFFKA